ncbi:MAG: flippase [Patescibacteria group bacterium]|jgi:O-antigen/teichoic acid export membrane protein
MSNTRKVAYNTIIQIIARVIVTLVSLVALAYTARYLGVVGMGQYNLIFAYLGLFGVILDFGFFLLQVREITKTPERTQYIIGNILGLKLALSLVVFTSAYLVAIFIYHDPIIILGVLIGVVSQASLSYAQVPISLFQARLQMDRVALSNVITRLAYVGLIFWAINANLGVIGIVIAATVANVLALIIQMLLAWGQVPILPQWDLGYWWKFVKEAAPLGAAVVLATVYFRVDSVMLSLLKGNYEVGIYTTPYKIVEVVLTIPTIFMSSVFPVLTAAVLHSREAVVRVFRKAFDFSMLLGVPIVIGATMIATPLMTAIAGPEFSASGPVLQIIIWTTLLSFIGAVLTYTLIAAGKQILLTIPYIIAAVFNIVANLLVIPRYSYIGASYITVATELIVTVYAGVLVYRIFKLTPAWPVLIKAIIASIIMAGVMYWLGSVNLIINIVVAMVVYGVMILILRAIPREVLKELKLVR